MLYSNTMLQWSTPEEFPEGAADGRRVGRRDFFGTCVTVTREFCTVDMAIAYGVRLLWQRLPKDMSVRKRGILELRNLVKLICAFRCGK
jgi:hypothetical protein